MKKKLLVLVLSAVMAVGMMSGCGAKSDTSDTKAKTAESSSAKEEETEEQTECELEDGTYTAEFKTDSGRLRQQVSPLRSFHAFNDSGFSECRKYLFQILR